MRACFLLFSFLILVATSCKEEQPPIDTQKMTKILTELHLAETYAQLTPIDKGGYLVNNTDTLLSLYAQIYKKHQIDSASLKEALKWYDLHPEQFDKVYENVLTALSILKVTGLDSAAKITDTTTLISDSALAIIDSNKMSQRFKNRLRRTDTL